MLPYGNLREPPSGLKRASIVVLTHCELAGRGTVDKIKTAVKKYNPSVPVIESSHTPDFFFSAAEQREVPVSEMNGKHAAALSAIGDPESFERGLTAAGMNIEQRWRYPDHHAFTEQELLSARHAAGSLPIVTTYKDFSRFPENWRKLTGEALYLLSINLTLTPGDTQALRNMINGLKIKK